MPWGRHAPRGSTGGGRLGTGQQLARLEWAIWTVFLWVSLVGQQGCSTGLLPSDGHMGMDAEMSAHRAGLV